MLADPFDVALAAGVIFLAIVVLRQAVIRAAVQWDARQPPLMPVERKPWYVRWNERREARKRRK